MTPSFFDVNEDSGAGVPHMWSLEVGDVETEVSDNFSFDPGAPRFLFQSVHMQASGRAVSCRREESVR